MLFNLFIERTMTYALEGHVSEIKCGGLRLCNLRFADDIDIIAGSEEELRELTERINSAANIYVWYGI